MLTHRWGRSWSQKVRRDCSILEMKGKTFQDCYLGNYLGVCVCSVCVCVCVCCVCVCVCVVCVCVCVCCVCGFLSLTYVYEDLGNISILFNSDVVKIEFNDSGSLFVCARQNEVSIKVPTLLDISSCTSVARCQSLALF